MQVALSVFSPTSATRKNQEAAHSSAVTLGVAKSTSACVAASEFYQLVAAAWSGGQCLTDSSLGTFEGLGLSKYITPSRQVAPCVLALQKLCQNQPSNPGNFTQKPDQLARLKGHTNMHIWLFGGQARLSTSLERGISSLGTSSGSLAQPDATQ